MTGSDDRQRAIERRLAAVERAVASDERAVASDERGDRQLGGEPTASLEERVEELTETVAAVQETTRELEAGLQAVRGYAGAIRAVNRTVERRADAALAAVAQCDGSNEQQSHPEPVPWWLDDGEPVSWVGEIEEIRE